MTPTLMPYPDAASEEAIIAATKTWVERAVIGLNLCPFAKSVFVKKQVRYALTAATTADELLAELEQELTRLAETAPEEMDTTLLIHPLVMTDFLDFHFFLAEADALIRNLGFEGVFQIASLHPRYEFAGSEADDIANFTNRSPYPTSSARAALTGQWRLSPTPSPFSNAISRQWNVWATRAGKSSG